MARAALGGLIAGVLMFLVMYFVVGFGTADAFYLSLSFATAVAAALAATEREANIGVVAGFAGICIASVLLHYLGVLGFANVGGILVRLPNFAVVIPTSLIPIFAVGFAGLVAFAVALGWDMGRFVMYLCGLIAWFGYFATGSPLVRLTSMTVVALVTSIPLVFEEPSRSRFMAVASIPIIASIDLSLVDASACIIPLLMFLAVDPTRRLSGTVRGLAAICILTIVMLAVLDIALFE